MTTWSPKRTAPILAALGALWAAPAAGAEQAPAPTSARICLNCHQPTPGTLRGHWDGFSTKARSIQLKIDGAAEVLRFDEQRLAVKNAPEQGDVEDMLESIKKGHEVRIEYAVEGGTRYARVVSAKPPVKLSDQDRIGLPEVEKLVAQGPGQGRTFLFDARPAPRFKEGTIPTAASLPFPEFDKVANRLPADKGSLVVFFCSGVTCNMSPGAQRKARALGYTNVKVFVEGMPAWYSRNPGVLSAQHLAEAYKDVPYVLLDARAPAVAREGFVQGAVPGNDEILSALPKKELKAPIVVYDQDGKGEALGLARKIVAAGQVNVNVLSDGFAGAKAAGFPVATGALAPAIAYLPRPRPGSLPPEEFRKLLAAIPADTILLDARGADEVARGGIPGAVNVPADQIEQALDKLPKDKRIVAFCSTGTRAEMAYHTLKGKGYANVLFLNARVEFKDGKATVSS